MKNLVARASQLISCPISKAFDAFVDPTKISQFWLASASGPLRDNASVMWQFMVPGATASVTVKEFTPPRLIGFTWSGGLEVRLTFSENSTGKTDVSAEVSGFTGEDAVENAINTTEGFSIVLCDLKTLLETGRSANLVRDKAKLIEVSAAAANCDA